MSATPPECRRLEALLERDLDGELTAEQEAFVRTHAAACAACRGRRDFQRRLRTAVDDALAAQELPPGLANRVLAALERVEGQ